MSPGPLHLRPVRVLQVVGGMNADGRNRGGVQTWLMNVMRRMDRAKVAMDFLVLTDRPCADEPEIRSLGGRLMACPSRWPHASFSRRFRAILRDSPYDVVHAHVGHFNGLILRAAAEAGVPRRIAHSHNIADRPRLPLVGGAYLGLMRHWISVHGTERLASSAPAVDYLFAPSRSGHRPPRVLYCGIDTARFGPAARDESLRERLGIESQARVVGHVGRLEQQKNHELLLEIAAASARARLSTHFMFVGDGPLREVLSQRIDAMQLRRTVHLLGARDDVADLMRSVFDVFILPSHYEGLGLAAVEAQAAGLPCVLSDVVPSEADVVPPLISRVSLAQSPEQWLQVLNQVLDAGAPVSHGDAFATVRASPFSIEASVLALEELYREAHR